MKYNETTKYFSTKIYPHGVEAETTLDRWYPLFRFNASAETGYCGNYIISVNRNNVNGTSVSYTYSLVIPHRDMISGYMINCTNGSSYNNQMTKLRVRTTTDDKLFIDGFICAGGNDTNTYYCGLTILHKKGKGSDSIVTYSIPESITDNASDVIRWSTDIYYKEPNYLLDKKQIGIYISSIFEDLLKPIWYIRNYGKTPYIFIKSENDETILWLFTQYVAGIADVASKHPGAYCIQISTKETTKIVSNCAIYSDEYSPTLSVTNVKRTSDTLVYTRIASFGYWYSYVFIATGPIKLLTDIGDYTVIEPDPEP